MPIPDEDKHTEDCVYIADALGIPKGWTLVFDVQPWLGCDLKYEIDKKHKAIEVTAYSARYPATLYAWMSELVARVHKAMPGWVE